MTTGRVQHVDLEQPMNAFWLDLKRKVPTLSPTSDNTAYLTMLIQALWLQLIT